MATVYLAHDHRHDRPVALKVLHPELAATLGPERFLREIKLAARLQHPHILTVLDSGEAAGRLWFTMPFVEGETLRDRLRRESQLPVGEALRICTEAALALDFAHRHGVVHRDIKPENILLCDGQALVADFGIGRALGQPAPDEHLTETGTVVGTPAYMSPEQASGDRALDARADIYSLGLVLYEMLAGELPFTGPTPQAILARRLTESPRPLRQARETIPEAIDQAVSRALAKAPADRFQTAAEFAHALASPGTTISAGAQPSARRRMGRGRAIAIGAGLTLLMVAAVLALRGRDPKPVPLDPSLLAVAPFEVLRPDLGIWREGLVDLLSRNLDGAGPLRTVSPAVVVRRWGGRGDRAAAEALGRGTGAGLVMYGSLVPAGGDSVRVAATVMDVGTGQVAAEADLRGDGARVDLLADSLTIRVLRGLGQTRTIGAVRASGLGSRSLPAVRAFLRGEQAFRRTEWDSARTQYEAAIAEDTAFGLAHWRLGSVRGWIYGVNDSLSSAYFARAGELNRGLAPRESLLIACDSLMAGLNEGATPDSAGWATLQRLFRTADLVVQRYPTDPESWVALGEARAHYGHGRGVTQEMTLDAFARAISLDSAYAPAYLHAVELAVAVEDFTAARGYAGRFLALKPGGEPAASVRATIFLLDSATTSAEADRLLDTVPVPVLFNVNLAFVHLQDSAETSLRIMRRLLSRPVPEDQWYHDRALREGMLASLLGQRGHAREAVGIWASRPGTGTLFVELALLGAIPADTADARFSRRLRTQPIWPPTGLAFAPAWWLSRGDSASLRIYRDGLRAGAPAAGSPEDFPNRYRMSLAEAYLRLLRGDTAAAVTGLQQLPIVTGQVYLERLTLARLLAAQGHDREALAVLDAGFPHPWPSPTRALWALERARLAERLGERDKAKRWYGYHIDIWRHADPELQSTVREARQALERLTAEAET